MKLNNGRDGRKWIEMTDKDRSPLAICECCDTCISIGPPVSHRGSPNPTIHLDRSDLRELLPHLIAFANRGKLEVISPPVEGNPFSDLPLASLETHR